MFESHPDLLQLGDEIQHLIEHLHQHGAPDHDDVVHDGVPVLDITPDDDDTQPTRQLKHSIAKRIDHYHNGWDQIEQLGAVVKDPQSGMVDFYGRVDDRLVWLCWQYGEQSIDFFHELDGGFSGRKPLAAARKRMLN